MIINQRIYLSLLLYSLSLALKQVAIFLLPLYLIKVWQSSAKVKDVILALLVILLIPTIASLPFLFWDSEGFYKSILFSATRYPEGHFKSPSVDVYIEDSIPGFVGIKAKLPMLLMMILVYLNALKRKVGLFTNSLLIMFVFINFNSVLFRQYFCWVMPLLPLAVSDILPKDLLDHYSD